MKKKSFFWTGIALAILPGSLYVAWRYANLAGGQWWPEAERAPTLAALIACTALVGLGFLHRRRLVPWSFPGLGLAAMLVFNVLADRLDSLRYDSTGVAYAPPEPPLNWILPLVYLTVALGAVIGTYWLGRRQAREAGPLAALLMVGWLAGLTQGFLDPDYALGMWIHDEVLLAALFSLLPLAFFVIVPLSTFLLTSERSQSAALLASTGFALLVAVLLPLVRLYAMNLSQPVGYEGGPGVVVNSLLSSSIPAIALWVGMALIVRDYRTRSSGGAPQPALRFRFF